ncbi:hypothetical protein JCM11641_000402 [Rhodosporidiobolus odoratus]
MLPILLLLALPGLSLALPLEARADDTGCNMNPGTDLMQCLGSWASVPPAVLQATGTGGGGLADQALGLCEQYTQIANCWGNGTFCREWLPVKTAADKLCALAASGSAAASSASASSPSSSSSSTSLINGTSTPASDVNPSQVTAIADAVPSETLSSVVAEASNVITSIWNNDSGTKIPSITNDIGTQTNPTWTAEGKTVGDSKPTSSSAEGAGGSNAAGRVGIDEGNGWTGLGMAAVMGAWVVLA